MGKQLELGHYDPIIDHSTGLEKISTKVIQYSKESNNCVK